MDLPVNIDGTADAQVRAGVFEGIGFTRCKTVKQPQIPLHQGGLARFIAAKDDMKVRSVCGARAEIQHAVGKVTKSVQRKLLQPHHSPAPRICAAMVNTASSVSCRNNASCASASGARARR